LSSRGNTKKEEEKKKKEEQRLHNAKERLVKKNHQRKCYDDPRDKEENQEKGKRNGEPWKPRSDRVVARRINGDVGLTLQRKVLKSDEGLGQISQLWGVRMKHQSAANKKEKPMQKTPKKKLVGV